MFISFPYEDTEKAYNTHGLLCVVCKHSAECSLIESKWIISAEIEDANEERVHLSTSS